MPATLWVLGTECGFLHKERGSFKSRFSCYVDQDSLELTDLPASRAEMKGTHPAFEKFVVTIMLCV